MRTLTQEIKVCKVITDRLELSLEIIDDAKNNREPKILVDYEKNRQSVIDAIACEEILGNLSPISDPMECETAPPTQEHSHDLPPAQIEKNQPIEQERTK